MGYLDAIDNLIVKGWVYNKTNPLERVKILVLVDGKPVAEGVANKCREDLKKAGIGDGCYGFEIRLPETLLDDKEHEVSVVVAETWEALKNSPQKIYFSKVIGYIDGLNGTNLVGWVMDKSDPTKRLKVDVYIDGEFIGHTVANKYREDLKRANIGDGSYGFEIKVPHQLLDDKTHKVILKSRDVVVYEAELKFPSIVKTVFDKDFYELNLRKNGISLKFNTTNEAIKHFTEYGWDFGVDPHPLIDFWYLLEHLKEIPQIKDPIDFIESFKNLNFQFWTPFIEPLYLNHNFSINTNQSIQENIIAFLEKKNIPVDWLHPHLSSPIVNWLLFNSNDKVLDIKKVANYKEFKHLVKLLRLGFEVKYDPKNVKVSVIILNYKKPILTILSALSALLSLKNVSSEIIIVDQEAEPFQTEILYRYLSSFKNVKILAVKENLYFGEGNNVAIDAAKGEYILFLNNDAFINEETIQKMIEFLDEKDEYTAVGPTVLNPNLLISEIGGIISFTGDVWQQSKGRKLDGELFKLLRKKEPIDVDYVSAACMLIRRSFLEEYGGFDFVYEPFYYEDTDLCMRIKHTGGKVACIPSVFALHLENISTKEKLKDSWSVYVEKSREVFLNRWLSQKEKSFVIKLPPKVSEKSKQKKTLALYTPYPIIIGGGENYLLSIGEALANDYEIYLITERPTSHTRVQFVMRDLKIKNYPVNILNVKEAQSLEFDVAVVMGNQVIPDALLTSKKILYHVQFPFPQWWHGHYFMDVVNKIHTFIVNSNFTKEQLLKELTKYKVLKRDVKVVYPPVNTFSGNVEELIARKVKKLAEDKEIVIVSIGRFQAGGHHKRQDIIAKLLVELAKDYPIKGYILGGLNVHSKEDWDFFNKVKEIAAEAEGKVIVKENVDREFLEDVLKRGHIYVHGAGLYVPGGFKPYMCEHFGISVAEAISYGLIPVVNKCGGPKEILEKVGIGEVYKTEDELLTSLKTLIQKFQTSFNEKDYIKTINKAVEKGKIFSRESFRKNIRTLIGEKIWS